MRAQAPWGLPDELLKPAKTQTDPIHQDIYWTKLETLLIDSSPIQRLRSVKQLGMTLKVYPGAEHSRFTHLLGTLAAAQLILDKILDNYNSPHRVPSLLDEWSAEDQFDLRWAEATVLARLAALLHDLTHVPFGHTIEDDLEVLTPHDRNEERFDALWDLLPNEPRQAIENATTRAPQDGRETRLYDELRAIVLDKVSLNDNGPYKAEAHDKRAISSYPFVADVVNNTICADLLDYIARDHYLLGLPFAVGDRFMDNFFIVPSYSKSTYAEHLVVRLVRDGEPRRDVRTELLKYLRYRYEETERALYHKTKLAYDAMLGKMLEMWKDSLWYDAACGEFPDLARDSRSLDATWLREAVRQRLALQPEHGVTLTDLDNRMEAEVERHFRFFGDEGLLEHIIWDLENQPALDDRRKGILDLAKRIRYRDHYRLLGSATGPNVLGVAQEKYDAFRTAQSRRDLERKVARQAGISPAWKTILWIPSPKMRLKIAEVLVQQDDGLIRPLARALPSDRDRATGDQDAALIVERHMQLWALRVYAPRSIRDNIKQCDRVLGFLQEELGLPLTRWDGVPVVPIARQVANDLREQRNWSQRQTDAGERRISDAAAKGEFARYDDLLELFAEEDPEDPDASGS